MGKADYQEYLRSPEWDALRKQVYRRADGNCELCGAPAGAVHHVRYPKQFKDDHPNNLLAVCEDCHKKLHGIREEVVTERPYVYCAGKVGYPNWRRVLFPDILDTDIAGDDLILGGKNPAVGDYECRGKLPLDYTGQVKYSGPFFVSCGGHGASHGPDSHGITGFYGERVEDTDSKILFPRSQIVTLCQQWLQDADAVFAWFDKETAHGSFGSLIELGWASSVGTPICIASNSRALLRETWFATHLPLTMACYGTGVKVCWEDFVSTHLGRMVA